MESYILISDAAKEVRVESHVLRYWEEELHLPIKRNELGHRYYTKEDVERFRQIKSMKEGGLQLKAIKMILKDGKLDVLVAEGEGKNARSRKSNQDFMTEEKDNKADMEQEAVQEETWKEPDGMAIDIVDSRENEVVQESKEEKSRRLQWLLQQLIRETLQENNKELCREIRESVVKELDYQFRAQEEKEEEREKKQTQRNEDYYQRMDELLRKKSRLRKIDGKKQKVKEKEEVALEGQKPEGENVGEVDGKQDKRQAKAEKAAKRKRHSIF